MCEYHQGLSMIGFKFEILFYFFLFTVECNDSLWNIEVDFDEMSWKGKVLWCAIKLLPNLVFLSST